jgi:hypothetical protein
VALYQEAVEACPVVAKQRTLTEMEVEVREISQAELEPWREAETAAAAVEEEESAGWVGASTAEGEMRKQLY